MPIKESSTTQTISLKSTRVAQFSFYAHCRPSSYTVLREWVNGYPIYSSYYGYVTPLPPSPYGPFPSPWFIKPETANTAVWKVCRNDTRLTDTSVPFLRSYSRISYTNSPQWDRFGFRVNPCTHVKLIDVSVFPGLPGPPTFKVWQSGTYSKAFEVLVGQEVLPSQFAQFIADSTESGLLTPFQHVDVSYGDFIHQILNPFRNEFLQSFAELGGLRDLALSVSKKLHNLKNLIPVLRSFLKNFGRKTGTARGAVSGTSGLLLEYQFGWKQVGDDVARLIAFGPVLKEHLNKLHRLNGKPVRKSFRRAGTDSYSFMLDESTTVSYEIEWVARAVVCARIRIPGLVPVIDSYLSNVGSLLRHYRLAKEYYGLTATPRRLWNLVPLSFLVDQVVPVADVLDDLGSSRYGVEIEPLYHSNTYKETVTVTVTHASGARLTFIRTGFERRSSSMKLFTHRGWFSLFRPSATNAALAGQKGSGFLPKSSKPRLR